MWSTVFAIGSLRAVAAALLWLGVEAGQLVTALAIEPVRETV